MTVRNLISAVFVSIQFVANTLAADAFLEQVDLFKSGEAGYVMHHIPGIVVTNRGTLLAYCEARESSHNDWAKIDILLRRSTDGGKNWSPSIKAAQVDGPIKQNVAAVKAKLSKDDTVTYNNPIAITSPRNGVIHFVFCIGYERCYYQQSTDDGVTFSRPVDITATFEQFRPKYAWIVLATGPGHGVALSNGRLIVPIWLSTGTGEGAHRPSVISTIYSDDEGKTWQCGEIAAHETDPLTNPNENIAVQLADGRVMLNIRHESSTRRRAVTFSSDGATGWSKPVFVEELLEPICMASMARLTQQGKHDRNRLLFSNPENLTRGGGTSIGGQSADRKNLTIRLSYDEGQTWPVSRVLEPGPSAYSDLAVGPDGTIYCLYDRGRKNPYETITLARFNLEWLSGGKDALPAAQAK